jgi:hypothetical protein
MYIRIAHELLQSVKCHLAAHVLPFALTSGCENGDDCADPHPICGRSPLWLLRLIAGVIRGRGPLRRAPARHCRSVARTPSPATGQTATQASFRRHLTTHTTGEKTLYSRANRKKEMSPPNVADHTRRITHTMHSIWILTQSQLRQSSCVQI